MPVDTAATQRNRLYSTMYNMCGGVRNTLNSMQGYIGLISLDFVELLLLNNQGVLFMGQVKQEKRACKAVGGIV